MNEIKSLRIEKLAMQGYGIARHNGKTFFVSYTAPGDVVNVRVSHQRKDIAFAGVTRYVSRGEGVREPSCEAFGPQAQCGGCDWLMLPYDRQLEQKDLLIRELFEPFVDPAVMHPIVPSPEEEHYRNKAFFPVASHKGRLSFGMYRAFTHEVVPHKSCVLQMPEFDRIARTIIIHAQKAGVEAYREDKHGGNLRQIGFRASSDGKEILVILVTKSGRLAFTNLLVKALTAEYPSIVGIIQNINTRRTNVILGDMDKVLFGRPWINEVFLGQKFRVHYRSFLQVNPGTAELAVRRIRQLLGSPKHVIDAYSGIGTIGLSIASVCGEVTCIEETPEAVEDGSANASLNGVRNVGFIRGRVEDVLAKLLQEKGRSGIDAMVLDPPRSGLDAKVISAISGVSIPKLIYMSCNPMTLARDIRALMEKGFVVSRLQAFDMFPQTWHIETLVELIRR